MSMQQWWIYLVTVFAISATPGPTMLLVMHSGMRHGLRGALDTMAGCMTALMVLMGLSAAGLGLLLSTSAHLFTVLRWLGAAYLIWLGIQCWRHATPRNSTQPSTPQRPAQRFRQGFLVAISNPKAILFFGALFPQFIQHDAPQTPQLLVMCLTFLIVESGWQLAYASGGARIAPWLETPRFQRRFNQTTGGVFIGFGALMALVQQK